MNKQLLLLLVWRLAPVSRKLAVGGAEHASNSGTDRDDFEAYRWSRTAAAIDGESAG